jgi:cell division protein FtsA
VARNSETMIVGIDIGSGNLRAVGAIRHEDRKYPIVVATYKKSLDGMDRGNIIDEREVANAITEAIVALEEQSGATTLHTLISLGATGLSSHHASGYAQVSRGDASVTDLDIENAIKDGNRAIPDIRNKSIVHAIPMDYKVDGNKIQGSIIGVRGNKLETKTLFVTYPLQCMNVLKKTLEGADVRVTDIVAGPIAESIPLLTKKQKIAGVALINIGQAVTSLLVYEKNIPLLVSTIAVGGDDITKDIALGMKVTLEEAEEMKCGRATYAYSKRKVEEIIEARLEDLCIKITKELTRIQRSELLPAGILVTGGSSLVPRLEYVFRNELRLPIKIVTNELVRITGDTLRDGGWARSYGLTFLAPHDTEKDVIKDLITSMWTRVKKVLSQFLP